MSTTMRVPDDVNASVKRIAALSGRPGGDLLAEAWSSYVEKHREEFARDFERAAALIRDGDTDGLARMASEPVAEQATAAAAAARRTAG